MFNILKHRNNTPKATENNKDLFQTIFDEFFNDSFFSPKPLLDFDSNNLGIDLVEEKDNYIVHTDLPGINKKDVEIELNEDGYLTIKATRNNNKEEKDKKYHIVERSYGTLQRVVTLPKDIVKDKIEAELKDGVLTIKIAKDKNSKNNNTKKIEIK